MTFALAWTALRKSAAVRGLALLTAILTALWAYGEAKKIQGRNEWAASTTKQAEKQVDQAKKARARGDAEPDPVEWMRRHRCTGC